MSETPIEQDIASALAAGQRERAITLALETYGPELLGYLHAILQRDADELFSELCERLWRGLTSFRGDSSFRTWAYRIARNLVHDRLRARARPLGQPLPLEEASEVQRIAQELRSTTAVYLQSETKTRLQQLRDALDPDDRTLLILRIDRGMSWREIARVMAEGETLAIDRSAARLRKRFERLKERLRAELGG